MTVIELINELMKYSPVNHVFIEDINDDSQVYDIIKEVKHTGSGEVTLMVEHINVSAENES